MSRADQVDYVSRELPSRAGLLPRLLVRPLHAQLSRSEAGLLSTLRAGPRRITELAELEGLAQPTTTLLVKRLEQQGLVLRERQADDGRVVVAHLTEAGDAALDALIGQVRVALREHLAETSDEEIAAFAAATEALGRLIAVLQRAAP